MRSFGESIYAHKASIVEAEEDQSSLLENLVKCNNKSKPKKKVGKDKKEILMKMHRLIMKDSLYWELTLTAFKSGIFPIKATQSEELKVLTPKKMLQRLPIAFAQVKASNTSENFLNEIREIIKFLYRAKKITKKVHKNIMNSIKV